MQCRGERPIVEELGGEDETGRKKSFSAKVRNTGEKIGREDRGIE